MKTRFDGFCDGKRQIHGDKFDSSDLDKCVVTHYNAMSRRRIKVEWKDGSTQWGSVGVTTGWKPVFLLMQNRYSRSSSHTLTPGSFRIIDWKDLPH